MSASRFLLLSVAATALAGCAASKAPVFEREAFGSASTFSRVMVASGERSCEAARRALLSQGYIISVARADLVQGYKNFQPMAESHVQISFNIVCVPEFAGSEHATVFVNAVQDRYALKKTNTAAGVGVSVLGSVSLPLPGSDDSLVKVASETIVSGEFYDRWFALLERYLPPEPPAGDAGTPARKPLPDAPG
jgi:hypothetical protein